MNIKIDYKMFPSSVGKIIVNTEHGFRVVKVEEVDWRKIKKYKRKGLLVNVGEIDLTYNEYFDLSENGRQVITDKMSARFIANHNKCYIKMKSKSEALKYKLKMS